MRRLKTAVTLAFLAAVIVSACVALPGIDEQAVEGSGTLAQDTRPISGVTAVELSMPGTLHIEIGEAESLRVSAEDNLLPFIETEARGGELAIETSPNVDLRPRQPIDYYLTVTALDSLGVSSSGDAEVPDLQAPHFSVTISSSGSVDINSLQAETLDAEISSSGGLTIGGGEVQRQEITLSSSGGYMAREMLSSEAILRISSSGSATIRVQDSIDGELSSSGGVFYLGSPQLNIRTSSSGKAVQIDN
jgi:hypothetical protein